MARTKSNIIEYRIYEMAPDQPFQCLYGDIWRISDVLSNRLHFHNCLEIGFCFSDSGIIGFEEERSIPFEAGDIFIIPRFVPHTTCSAPGCRSQWNYLFVDMDTIAFSDGSDYKRHPSISSLIGSCLRLTRDSHQRLHTLCMFLLEEAKTQEQGDLTLFNLYTVALLKELQRLSSSEEKKHDANRAFVLRPVLEYINNHYMEPCSVEKLSSLCHLSQTHFRRLFLSIMGTSPLQYVIQMRIRQACILLNTTNEPITTVAQAVGIASISSFNRNFQQVMNVTPQQYRQAIKPQIASQKKYILPYKGWLVPENL